MDGNKRKPSLLEKRRRLRNNWLKGNCIFDTFNSRKLCKGKYFFTCKILFLLLEI